MEAVVKKVLNDFRFWEILNKINEFSGKEILTVNRLWKLLGKPYRKGFMEKLRVLEKLKLIEKYPTFDPKKPIAYRLTSTGKDTLEFLKAKNDAKEFLSIFHPLLISSASIGYPSKKEFTALLNLYFVLYFETQLKILKYYIRNCENVVAKELTREAIATIANLSFEILSTALTYGSRKVRESFREAVEEMLKKYGKEDLKIANQLLRSFDRNTRAKIEKIIRHAFL